MCQDAFRISVHIHRFLAVKTLVVIDESGIAIYFK